MTANRESITVDTLKESMESEQVEMEVRRRRIREKAEELLKRARKQTNPVIEE